MGSGTLDFIGIGHILADNFVEELARDIRGQSISDLIPVPNPVNHVDPDSMNVYLAIVERRKRLGLARSLWRLGGGAPIVAILLARCGLRCQVDATVGADARGIWLDSILREEGIGYDQEPEQQATGVFSALKTVDGESLFLVCPGAARGIRGRSVDSMRLSDEGIIYLDGLLADDPDWLEALASGVELLPSGRVFPGSAPGTGKPRMVLDLSTPGNVAARGAYLAEFAAKYCDYVFANEPEFRLAQPYLEKIDTGDTAWIVKRGDRGAEMLRKGYTVHTVAAKPAIVRNTVGAGDAFAAGFLLAVSRGMPEDLCMEMGASFAAAMISARGNFPEPGELRRLF